MHDALAFFHCILIKHGFQDDYILIYVLTNNGSMCVSFRYISLNCCSAWETSVIMREISSFGIWSDYMVTLSFTGTACYIKCVAYSKIILKYCMSHINIIPMIVLKERMVPDLTLTFLLMISRLIRTRPSDKSIPDKGTSVSPMTSSRENLSKLSTMKWRANSDTRASGIP